MAKSKILFDHQIFQSQKYGGISRYFVETLSRLTEDPSLQISLYLGRSINEYGIENQSQKFKHFRGWKQSSRFSSKLNRIEFPVFSSLIRPDITHFTYYRDTSPFFKGTRVLTVYDMIHEIFPAQFGAKDATARWKKQGISKADHIISISESTKRDLIRFFGIPEEKINVIHLANSLFVNANTHSFMSKPYILFVGLRGGYKNFENLLRGLQISKLGNDFDILAFGGPQLTPEEINFVKSCGLENKVHHRTGGDQDLATAYKHASVFVFPSLYEGFGIPPLEAMHYGCPVIGSNVSSVPEIMGDGGILVPAQEPEAIANALLKVLQDSSFRKNLVENGFRRTKMFSWDRCAQEHRDLYLRL